MPEFKNILVPTDFSKFSMAAVPYAIELASKYNGKIHLIYVQEKTPPVMTVPSVELTEEKIKQRVEEEVETSMRKAEAYIGDLGFNDVISVIKNGIEHEEIINYSEDSRIDIIVIASHGRSGLLHTLMGSVAEKVIRHCKCPVLVITPVENKI